MSVAKWFLGLAPCLIAAGCSDEQAQPRSVVLVTLEATRQDVVGVYGGSPSTAGGGSSQARTASATPNLDLLAKHGVHYRWARTVAPMSRPAHASILTGLYPPRHGVRSDASWPLTDRAETLAELALAAGFQTAGFVGSRRLDEASGLAQGFEVFGRPSGGALDATGAPSERTASAVAREASAWLRGRDPSRPFLLWVHFNDASLPRRVAGRVVGAGQLDPYAAEVAEVDRALGELIEVLRSQRLFQESFIAVVGSRGEGLGEHGEATHGLGLWDSTIKVPLLLCYPDGYGAGEVSGEVVSVVDVAPTLLAAMDVAGSSRLSRLDGASLYYESVPTERGVYFESYEGWRRFGVSPLVGFADARGKLVRGAREELFDPRRDPGERSPLSLSDGAPERFALGIAEARAGDPLLADDQRLASVDAGVLESLEALGYALPAIAPTSCPLPGELQAFLRSVPGNPGELRDPRDALADQDELERALASLHAGGFEAASTPLWRLRAAYPDSVDVLDALGTTLVAMDEHEQAVEVLRSRLRLAPERIETHRDLRICFNALGEVEPALQHSIRALELQVELHQRERDPEALRRARTLLGQTRAKAALETPEPGPKDTSLDD